MSLSRARISRPSAASRANNCPRGHSLRTWKGGNHDTTAHWSHCTPTTLPEPEQLPPRPLHALHGGSALLSCSPNCIVEPSSCPPQPDVLLREPCLPHNHLNGTLVLGKGTPRASSCMPGPCWDPQQSPTAPYRPYTGDIQDPKEHLWGEIYRVPREPLFGDLKGVGRSLRDPAMPGGGVYGVPTGLWGQGYGLHGTPCPPKGDGCGIPTGTLWDPHRNPLGSP